MEKISDKELIKEYIKWCIKNDFTIIETAGFVKRTKQWASLLINDKIHRLQFRTRSRIKGILGIHEE